MDLPAHHSTEEILAHPRFELARNAMLQAGNGLGAPLAAGCTTLAPTCRQSHLLVLLLLLLYLRLAIVLARFALAIMFVVLLLLRVVVMVVDFVALLLLVVIVIGRVCAGCPSA